jgi:hypothetical protein
VKFASDSWPGLEKRCDLRVLEESWCVLTKVGQQNLSHGRYLRERKQQRKKRSIEVGELPDMQTLVSQGKLVSLWDLPFPNCPNPHF